MKKQILSFVALAATAFGAHAYDFTYDNLLVASMKMQSSFDYSAHVNGYMEQYRKAVWRKYNDDEFALNDKQDETIAMMKERAESMSLEEPIQINTTFKFGKYDFDRGAFPLESIGANSYYSTDFAYIDSFPRQYKVTFDNPEMIGDIPMPKEEARSFIESKKKYGNVDRRLAVELKFVLEDLKADQQTYVAHIVEAKVYGSRTADKVVAEFTD